MEEDRYFEFVYNISSDKLSVTEIEDLSFSLNLATEIRKEDTLTTLTKIHIESTTQNSKRFSNEVS